MLFNVDVSCDALNVSDDIDGRNDLGRIAERRRAVARTLRPQVPDSAGTPRRGDFLRLGESRIADRFILHEDPRQSLLRGFRLDRRLDGDSNIASGLNIHDDFQSCSLGLRFTPRDAERQMIPYFGPPAKGPGMAG